MYTYVQRRHTAHFKLCDFSLLPVLKWSPIRKLVPAKNQK